MTTNSKVLKGSVALDVEDRARDARGVVMRMVQNDVYEDTQALYMMAMALVYLGDQVGRVIELIEAGGLSGGGDGRGRGFQRPVPGGTS